jgi:hypothetical protein
MKVAEDTGREPYRTAGVCALAETSTDHAA